MKSISQIRKELDELNRTPFNEESATELRELGNEWERCFLLDLGEVRDVIEDRFKLAHSHRRRAGF